MAKQIQFAGANYHIVTRGDGRRRLFHDTGHYERFTAGLEDEADLGVPEPLTLTLAALGLLSLGMIGRRRRRR